MESRKYMNLPLDPRKILIVKPSSLGDVVHSLPFLNAIKTRFPKAEIHWVIARGFEGLLEGHPMIDKLWVIDKDAWKKISQVQGTVTEIRRLFRELKGEKFDIVIDLQGLLRSGIITVATGSPLRIGFKEAREGSRFFYTHKVAAGKDIHAVDRYLRIASFLGCDISQISFPFPDFTNEFVSVPSQLSFPRAKRVGNPSENKKRFRTSRNDRLTTESGFINDSLGHSSSSFILHPSSFKDYVVIVPGARWKTKIWPAEKFGELSSLLPLKSVIVGDKNDKDVADEIVSLSEGKSISLTGKTTLRELIDVIRHAEFVISNDSGPMHIAAALGIPVFAIFGSTDPARTGPYGKGHTIIRQDISCSPCFKKTCDDMKCMKSISADKIFGIIKSRQRHPV
jgi:lipopolysaccharide heptosyltransferase I